MVSTSSPSRWRQAPHLIREVRDGLMLLSPASDGEPVLLDISAQLIWECLVEPVSVDELASDIADQFQTDQAEVRTVLQSTIAQLADQLLVEEA